MRGKLRRGGSNHQRVSRANGSKLFGKQRFDALTTVRYSLTVVLMTVVGRRRAWTSLVSRMACYTAVSPLALSAVSLAISDICLPYPKVHFEMFCTNPVVFSYPSHAMISHFQWLFGELSWVQWLTSVSHSRKGEGISLRQLTCSQDTEWFCADFFLAQDP